MASGIVGRIAAMEAQLLMARGASRAKLPADSDAAAAGHVEQALADFDASLGLQEQAPTYNAMGNVLKAARRGEEAMQAYESALELDPEFAVAHFNLGALRHAQGCVARLQSSPAASCLCSFAPLPSRRVRPSLFESVCVDDRRWLQTGWCCGQKRSAALM